jgi:carbonic anhydrase/acetyltransferase-like protein (isoleucine patch superfamily)
MAVYRYRGYEPIVGKGCYISDSARVIGNVVLKENCYIGHGAIIRADHGMIQIGQGSAIEENVVIHVRVDKKYILEEHITLGHGAIIHGDIIKAFAVIGMGAIVGRQTIVGRWGIVAEGAVVPTGKSVEDETIVAGIPAREIGKVNSHHKEYWRWAKQVYENLAHDYENDLVKLY